METFPVWLILISFLVALLSNFTDRLPGLHFGAPKAPAVHPTGHKKRKKHHKKKASATASINDDNESFCDTVTLCSEQEDGGEEEEKKIIDLSDLQENGKVYEVFCANSAYENLISIIYSKQDFYQDFVGIWRAIFKDAEMEKIFKAVQREKGSILGHALRKKRAELVDFLLTHVSPLEGFLGEPVWKVALTDKEMLTLILDDGRVQKIEIILEAIKEKYFNAILWVAFHASFNPAQIPFLLHELARHGAPVYLFKALFEEGLYQADTLDGFKFNILHYAIIMKHRHLVKFLIDEAWCDVNAPGGVFQTPPLFLAIRTSDIEILKTILSAPQVQLHADSQIFFNALECAEHFLKEANAVDYLGNPIGIEARTQCYNLVLNATEKQEKIDESVHSVDESYEKQEIIDESVHSVDESN